MKIISVHVRNGSKVFDWNCRGLGAMWRLHDAYIRDRKPGSVFTAYDRELDKYIVNERTSYDWQPIETN